MYFCMYVLRIAARHITLNKQPMMEISPKAKDLIEELVALNEKARLQVGDDERYRCILTELATEGVTSFAAYCGIADLEVPALNDVVAGCQPAERYCREYGLSSLQEFLEVIRLDVEKAAGFGAGKWMKIWQKQKLYWDWTSGTPLPGMPVTKKPIPLPPYDPEELRRVADTIIGMEILGEKKDLVRCQGLLSDLAIRDQRISDLIRDTELADISVDIPTYQENMMREWLRRLGVNRLADVMDIAMDDVNGIVGMGRGVMCKIARLKRDILDNPQYYIDAQTLYGDVYELPKLPQGEALDTFFPRFCIAMEQMICYLKLQNNKYASFLEKYYGGMSLADMGKATGKTKQAYESVRNICFAKILSGDSNPITSNVYLSDAFLEEMQQRADDAKYLPLSVLKTEWGVTSATEKHLDFAIDLLDLKTLAANPMPRMVEEMVIGSDEMGGIWSNDYVKVPVEILMECPQPMTSADVVRAADKKDGKTRDLSIVERVLQHHQWVEHSTEPNGEIYYKVQYAHLKSDPVRVTRLLYEAGRQLTLQELQQMHQEQPGAGSINIGSAVVRAADVRCVRNGVWIYQGAGSATAAIPLHEAIRNYATMNVEFQLSDITLELKKRPEYADYSDGTFRAYILRCCQSSNTDSNRFRLSSAIAPADSAKWRSRRASGFTNWIVTQSVNVLRGKTGMMKIRDLKKELKALPSWPSSGENNFTSILYKYAYTQDAPTHDEIFCIDMAKGEICLDKVYVEQVDLSRVGFVDKRPKYYAEMMEKIVSLLKDAPDCTMSHKALHRLCNKAFAHIEYADHAFYKVVSHLTDEVKEVERFEKDGLSYFRYLA